MTNKNTQKVPIRLFERLSRGIGTVQYFSANIRLWLIDFVHLVSSIDCLIHVYLFRSLASRNLSNKHFDCIRNFHSHVDLFWNTHSHLGNYFLFPAIEMWCPKEPKREEYFLLKAHWARRLG
jgi:hypothetical protein